MVAMTVVVKVRPEKREEFLHAMRSLKADPEKQKGLKRVTLSQEIDDQNAFSFIYEWETQEDLKSYLRGEKFKVLDGAFRVLCEKSEINYSDIREKLREHWAGVPVRQGGSINGRRR